MKHLVIVSILILNACKTFAQSNFLDPAFGSNGIVIYEGMEGNDLCNEIALDSMGRILVVGESFSGAPKDFALLLRLLPSGLLDSTFGDNGVSKMDFGQPENNIQSVAVQKDQKIVVVGNAGFSQTKSVSMARLWPDGAPDSTFGFNGQVVMPIGSYYNVASDVKIQDDGKIIVCGSASDVSSDADFFLIRLLPDGSLDPTFGQNGVVRTGKSGVHENAIELALQADGKIVVAGQATGPGLAPYRVALLRYLPNGQLDNTFSPPGQYTLNNWQGENRAYAVLIQADGKILIAGESYIDGEESVLLARLNSNRTLDNTFGENGIIRTQFQYGEGASDNCIGLQPDGKVLLTGFQFIPPSLDIFLLRFNDKGERDSTFGINGLINTDIYQNDDSPRALIMQPDEKILIAGYTRDDTVLHCAVVRFLPKLSLDADDFFDDNALQPLFYPNPITDGASVTFELPEKNHLETQLLNIHGQIVMDLGVQVFPAGKSTLNLQFPISLKNGIYFLKLGSARKSAVIKIILSR
ncbi:MAG: T9SS type A sorting domain-containing protein [Phycisphaerae bacterium]|nr:T9SS type A sorting domain-containing protein [Saprospiraceae bacterium]